MLLEEIRDAFANLPSERVYELQSLPSRFPAFAYVMDGTYGVDVIADPPIQVFEQFASARLYSSHRVVGGASRPVLRLEAAGAHLRNEFAAVCAQFLEPGADGSQRKSLLAEPLEWWSKWRGLLGNAVRELAPYSVLGELLAWEHLLDQDRNAAWLGPKANSHDIESSMGSYEVKSTLSRYEYRVHISGQHQLTPAGQAPLHLVFQRFEPNPNGVSIDDAVARLAARARKEIVEKHLNGLGYPAGSSARKERYSLLESVLFPVGKDFPHIPFPAGGLPKGIISVQYVADISSLSRTPFISVNGIP